MITKSTSLPASIAGDASLKRPKFSTGMLLQEDDLTQAVDYMREMTRLLFKSMLGCGVLCGFKVTAKIICNNHLQIEVTKGVALDWRGDLIELSDKETIEYAPPCEKDTAELPSDLWVLICHKERDCSPRDVLCSSQDGEVAPMYTRTREGYEIKILRSEKDAQPPVCCTCASTFDKPDQERTKTCCDYIAIPVDGQSCYADHYQGDCACDCGCECIALARVLVRKNEAADTPYVDHSVRRYIRPVLMKDPLPRDDDKPPQKVTQASRGAAKTSSAKHGQKEK
jgi:hypothetical protein